MNPIGIDCQGDMCDIVAGRLGQRIGKEIPVGPHRKIADLVEDVAL